MEGYLIHRAERIAQGLTEFWVEAPLVARKHRAGQFIILRLHDHGERIPLTVVQCRPEEGTIRLIVQAVGRTTIDLEKLGAGDRILDVVGPLGRPTDIENWGTMIAIGGGVGCAPLLPIVKAAKAAGNRVAAIVGARSKSLLILEDEFRAVCDEVRVATDDGSYGEKGLVTDTLRKWHNEGGNFEQAIVVGPVIMMSAVAKLTKELGIPALASLNPIMVDGTGMCGACRVTVYDETRFACVEGPEFDAHGVDFEELMLRNRSYAELELEARKRQYSHVCKLTQVTEAANV